MGKELTFPKRQILDDSKLKEFADDNSRFDESDRWFFRWAENTGGKGELLDTSNSSFSHSIFKRLLVQTCKNQGFYEKVLMYIWSQFEMLISEIKDKISWPTL